MLLGRYWNEILVWIDLVLVCCFGVEYRFLSICIPAYNRREWLRRALVSAIAKGADYQDGVEIVVSGDSAIAECREIMRSMGR
jgi:hypothetical protein